MADVISLFQEKVKRESIFNLEQAAKDVEHYEKVAMKSVEDFHTYSVTEKHRLYQSLVAFNIQILRNLINSPRKEV